MTKLAGTQLSLIAESDCDDRAVGDWAWDDVGTEKIPVPTSPISKIGTETISVPTSPISEIGTETISVPTSPISEIGTGKIPVPTSSISEIGTDKIPVPIFTVDFRVVEKWQPPIGCLEQKWSKDRKYWYWRYYDNIGKKRSLYLAKDYNKAVRKAMKIGIPSDAKLPQPTRTKANPQNSDHTASNLIDIAQTAHGTSRSPRAA